ncbi:MAG TPA: dTDP-4-dehydrorhamnose 3,5-epimerase family protein [Candidatus Nanoarchaeia archaeon]|nr:dTDP-4-dehydrorhamnose 3,5-epimerase family protein [Candidatus Nanoarchaeia archaeon]
MIKIEIKNLKMYVDNRGWLAEIFRPEDVNNTMNGQVTITTAHPGIVKANHYHKKMNEWYCVIKGKMHLVLKDMKSGEKKEIMLSEDDLKIIKISPGLAHGFRNVGDDMLFVLMYIDRPFDPNDPDTFPEVVI